ncbi:unnamed protein product [Nesidiocoris tenuis]|uniref:Uncharacterized protein n=1 Tax=Nesidiocoris tenuis TaxID=355587 RepID=A0A6H5HY80_9HEMI|nr:unnamed protein product [Nesidiocoris tenuis]
MAQAINQLRAEYFAQQSGITQHREKTDIRLHYKSRHSWHRSLPDLHTMPWPIFTLGRNRNVFLMINRARPGQQELIFERSNFTQGKSRRRKYPRTQPNRTHYLNRMNDQQDRPRFRKKNENPGSCIKSTREDPLEEPNFRAYPRSICQS